MGESTWATARWCRGARSVKATAASLAALPEREWVVVQGPALPGRGTATIDHVAIGPTGVYVIDSRTWSGRITTANGVMLRNGRSQEGVTGGVREAAEAIAALLPSMPAERVVPVLCFTDGDVPDLTLGGVCVCSIVTIAYLLSFRPVVLTPAEVAAAARELRGNLPPDKKPKRQATQSGP